MKRFFIQRSKPIQNSIQRMNIDDQSRLFMTDNSELTMEYARLQQNIHFNSKNIR